MNANNERKERKKQTYNPRVGWEAVTAPTQGFSGGDNVTNEKKERKKTDNPREGWEDGTPPPHRDFKEGTVWC